jgi:hypothetical protein
MIELTYEKALELLEEVVAGNENLVYEQPAGRGYCSYVAGKNTIGCGVGQVFRKAGVRILDLSRLDNIGYVGTLSGRFDIIKLDDKAIELLRTFQVHQDNNIPWGAALELAKGVNDD